MKEKITTVFPVEQRGDNALEQVMLKTKHLTFT